MWVECLSKNDRIYILSIAWRHVFVQDLCLPGRAAGNATLSRWILCPAQDDRVLSQVVFPVVASFLSRSGSPAHSLLSNLRADCTLFWDRGSGRVDELKG